MPKPLLLKRTLAGTHGRPLKFLAALAVAVSLICLVFFIRWRPAANQANIWPPTSEAEARRWIEDALPIGSTKAKAISLITSKGLSYVSLNKAELIGMELIRRLKPRGDVRPKGINLQTMDEGIQITFPTPPRHFFSGGGELRIWFFFSKDERFVGFDVHELEYAL
jgi:hypothetical protein